MAALVQGYPQQSSTVTMLQTRPASAGGVINGGQMRHGQAYSASSHRSRNSYAGVPTGYRGSTSSMQQQQLQQQPRTFVNQPNVNHNMQWQQYVATRTNSASSIPTVQSFDPGMQYRPQIVANGPVYNQQQQYGVAPVAVVRDDTALIARNMGSMQRPQSNYYVPGQQSNVTDRYRRANAQAVQHNRSQSANMVNSASNINMNNNMYQLSHGSLSVPNLSGNTFASPPTSPEDSSFAARTSNDEAFRARRRTASSGEIGDHSRPGSSAHSRDGSSESASSARSSISRPSSANKHVSTSNPSLSSAAENQGSGRHEQSSSLTNASARNSSSDAIKRTISPSPLSKQANLSPDASEDAASQPVNSMAASSNLNSPAAKQLAAINQKGGKSKSKTSRLRRAFSFGSAADFRKAAEEETAKEPSRLQKQPTPEQAFDVEQARIAQAQEAAGMGNSIYGSRFFGSTDNLSISSTASSASIMIRKMGRGMKKSTRSLVGLFRPKSVIGVPAAEPLEPETSQATVSMVTVEAEAQRVNVTADPTAANGGTGFPHLERNSLDASQLELPEISTERLGSSGTDSSGPRRNIVGGERERAEILAAVRKGILKRPGSASPSIRPTDLSPELILPPIPAISDSPISSAPSTPNDDAQGHRRTGSIVISNDDYFVNALRVRRDSRSLPGTPNGSAKRSATFSPRIIFHDTWPPQEYDRRGDVATCNRLTPLLAQQIKEELNSFKMEMEVHENSKIYTHFF